MPIVKPLYSFETDLTVMQKKMAEVSGVTGFESEFTTLFLWVMSVHEGEQETFDSDDIYDFLADYMILGYKGFVQRYKKYLDNCERIDTSLYILLKKLNREYPDIELRDPAIHFERLKKKFTEGLSQIEALMKREPDTHKSVMQRLVKKTQPVAVQAPSRIPRE